MPKMHSWDLVLFQTSIFGVNPGHTGRYIGPRIAWILGILNLCYGVTIVFIVNIGNDLETAKGTPINHISQLIYLTLSVISVVIIQIRYLSRRFIMAPLGRQLSRLCELSTWNGEIYGCVRRMMIYLSILLLWKFLPALQYESENWRMMVSLTFWANFVPTVVSEFIGQAMGLFKHEFRALSRTAEDVAKKGNFGIEKLRALNKRHASLSAIANEVARKTGIDTLLIIETERLLILVTLFVQVNRANPAPMDFGSLVFVCGCHFYRIERVAQFCIRSHGVSLEAERFVSTLDGIDPFDLENDEFFTEIFRKQVRMRELQFDCNRFLKLEMKLILRMAKDLLTLILILVQLAPDNSTVGKLSTASSITQAENATEYFLESSGMQSNLSTVV